jgi:hypothetical protein
MGLQRRRLQSRVVAGFYLASRGMYISFSDNLSSSIIRDRNGSEEINGAAEIDALLRKLRKN